MCYIVKHKQNRCMLIKHKSMLYQDIMNTKSPKFRNNVTLMTTIKNNETINDNQLILA